MKSRAAASESPPRSKKLSCNPTWCKCNTWRQMAATRSVNWSAESLVEIVCAESGDCSRARSILPFAFIGSEATATIELGTIADGRCLRR